jgi:hypothetical protein
MTSLHINGTEYRKGEPPAIGWWPTLTGESEFPLIRWWNGMCWSVGANEKHDKHYAERCARSPAPVPDRQIHWADRPAHWPEWSRT